MPKQAPQPVYLSDYTPPDYLVDTVELRFDLGDEATRVESRLRMRRNPCAGDHQRPLSLDGECLVLEHIALDDTPLDENAYRLGEHSLTIAEVPEQFTLEARTRIEPHKNTALEGLYKSSGTFCTQCEAEGFRRITYYPDRPDVMARFSTTIIADREACPVMLSNGNPIARGATGDGRHWVTWDDPYPKPSYLFALVAGRLACVEDTFRTRSGRDVALRIYVEAHNADKCAHAMRSLKKAMQWDEERFGLEYDLDIFMIVAVDDFNMGAMENKGLNVFNSKYVLANPQTATDDDYAAIEGIIAHEYFHNWTGNRVTLRDWFQLSLKEGLTVFRDQEFSADMGSRPVTRIRDVRVLRSAQFTEDSGPMAHPVRPASYIEINNFYTATIYNKGAELIRMIHTLIGREAFRRGIDLYFQRHDGEAVTTDDFVAAMQDASGCDLTQFKRWYTQAGTPTLAVSGAYDADARTYTLSFGQSCPATPGQSEKAPFHLPVMVALLAPDGTQLPLRLAGERAANAPTARVLDLTGAQQSFCFEALACEPVPSVLRDFSAPVRLALDHTPGALAFLSGHDTDPFNRWEAGQTFAVQCMLDLVERHHGALPLCLHEDFQAAFARTLADPQLDPALVAEALVLPAEGYLADLMVHVDVDAIHAVREFVRHTLAVALSAEFRRVYQANLGNAPYSFDAAASGRRKLKNVCLAYLMELDDAEVRGLCLRQFEQSDNMTDVLAALRVLANTECPEREPALSAFAEKWRSDPLVLDKWFSVQATSRLPGTLAAVKHLLHDPGFNIKNPNKVRAVVGAFCYANPVHFHAAGGEGYDFLAERVMEIDPLNPQVAARLVGALAPWRKLDAARQARVEEALERIVAARGLSRDAFEVATKTLGQSAPGH